MRATPASLGREQRMFLAELVYQGAWPIYEGLGKGWDISGPTHTWAIAESLVRLGLVTPCHNGTYFPTAAGLAAVAAGKADRVDQH